MSSPVGEPGTAGAPFPLAIFLLLDGYVYHAAPLGPGAVVVADLRVAQQVLEDEPRVGGALPDAAVGDDLLVGRDALAFVEGLQLLDGLEGAVLAHGLAPGNALGARDVPHALSGLLQPRRRHDLAVVLGRRAHVDQGAAAAAQAL